MSDSVLGISLGALCVAVIVLCIAGAYHEQEQWSAFAAANNCKVIGHMKGDVSTGFGMSASGNMVMTTSTTPDKKGYACDDGKQYWR